MIILIIIYAVLAAIGGVVSGYMLYNEHKESTSVFDATMIGCAVACGFPFFVAYIASEYIKQGRHERMLLKKYPEVMEDLPDNESF